MPVKKLSKPHCFLCKKKPAKVLQTSIPYRGAYLTPLFCSKACAADYALLYALQEAEGEVRGWHDQHWCPEQKTWSDEEEGDCPYCTASLQEMEV